MILLVMITIYVKKAVDEFVKENKLKLKTELGNFYNETQQIYWFITI